MDPLKRTASVLLAGALLLPLGYSAAPAANRAPESLFRQSASALLERDFPSDSVSYLLLDAQSGAVLASRWDDAERPIAVGSLMKPLVALAYGRTHAYRYPETRCDGHGCWLPRGHGELGLTEAITYSCNIYFRGLAGRLNQEQISSAAHELGISAPEVFLSPDEMIGLGSRWKVAPESIAKAYAVLAQRQTEPGVHEVLAGMEASADRGTALGVDRELRLLKARAKTGTATCSHHPRAPGDGFTLAMAPADVPEVVLLVRVHGKPGSQAAFVAGEMLHRLLEPGER